MTDIQTNQIATIIPSSMAADARVNQIAMVVVASAIPPVAGGALVNQIAIVSVGREYKIPLHLHGWLIRSIQGFPYYIEDDGI